MEEFRRRNWPTSITTRRIRINGRFAGEHWAFVRPGRSLWGNFYRPDLVGLFVLDAGFPEPTSRAESGWHAAALFVIYTGASIGSVSGGWLSSSLLKRGWSLNSSRKTAMLACALAVTPIVIAARTGNAWLAIVLIALAAGAHQGWSANLYTLASDMFPRSAVGSVVGFASTMGAIGGMLVAKAVGYILQRTGSYVAVFFLAGSAYLIALCFIQVLSPRLKPAQL